MRTSHRSLPTRLPVRFAPSLGGSLGRGPGRCAGAARACLRRFVGTLGGHFERITLDGPRRSFVRMAAVAKQDPRGKATRQAAADGKVYFSCELARASWTIPDWRSGGQTIIYTLDHAARYDHTSEATLSLATAPATHARLTHARRLECTALPV